MTVELPSELSLDWILLSVFETVRLVPARNFLLTLRSRLTRPEYRRKPDPMTMPP